MKGEGEREWKKKIELCGERFYSGCKCVGGKKKSRKPYNSLSKNRIHFWRLA
jgi:hypothetical protein